MGMDFNLMSMQQAIASRYASEKSWSSTRFAPAHLPHNLGTIVWLQQTKSGIILRHFGKSHR